MSPLEVLVVLGAGLAAGVLTSTVGVASLVSFPVLVGLGVPPVTANASNTVGLLPGGLSGSFGYRSELRAHPRVAVAVLGTCAVGAVAGAFLLLALPPGVFEAVVPWLVLMTAALVGVQPWVSARVRARRGVGAADRVTMSPVTTAFATLTGVYGGYFGAGSGVMMMAVLGFGLDIELRFVNALKTLAVTAGNLVATAIFLVLAPLDWQVILLLAAGSVVGGYAGSFVGRRLPDRVLRTLVVVAGLVAFVVLL